MNQDFFPEDTEPKPAAKLTDFILLGDLAGAIKYFESLTFDQATDEGLKAGFWISGSRKDKTEFYAFVGKQIRTACNTKSINV